MPDEKRQGVETQKNKKAYNPADMDTDVERKLMGIKKDEDAEGTDAELSEGSSDEVETDEEKQKVAEEENKAKRERKEKRKRELEEALNGTSAVDEVMNADEAGMSENEKALSRKLKEERLKNVRREESDKLNSMLESYEPEEVELMTPEISKFIRSKAYKSMSGLTVNERVAIAINHARGMLADTLMEGGQKKTEAEIAAKRKIEELSGGPTRKPARNETNEQKKRAELRKRMADGDVRAHREYAQLDDPIFDKLAGSGK
jgi:hypothetical protein